MHKTISNYKIVFPMRLCDYFETLMGQVWEPWIQGLCRAVWCQWGPHRSLGRFPDVFRGQWIFQTYGGGLVFVPEEPLWKQYSPDRVAGGRPRCPGNPKGMGRGVFIQSYGCWSMASIPPTRLLGRGGWSSTGSFRQHGRRTLHPPKKLPDRIRAQLGPALATFRAQIW